MFHNLHTKVVDKILREFDELWEGIKSIKDPATQQLIQSFSDDLYTLNNWREELRKGKQTIYVVGKTSTGKSTFHNELVDKKKFPFEFSKGLFAESTRVETGVLQSIEHVKAVKESKVILHVIDQVHLEQSVNLEAFKSLSPNVYELPLDSEHNINLLRESVMRESPVKGYNPKNALSRIEIFAPLKEFHKFRLVDTPGLGSHKSDTDMTVRKHIKSSAHVLWLLDASEVTLSNDASVLQEEVKNDTISYKSIKSIHFLANRWDILEERIREAVNETTCFKEEMEKAKKEINDKLIQALGNFERDDINLYFTCFKRRNKKLYEESLESLNKIDLILNKKEPDVTLDIVESLVDALITLLEKCKAQIIEGKLREIEQEIEQHKEELRKQEIIIDENDKKKKEIEASTSAQLAKLKEQGQELVKVKCKSKYNHFLDNALECEKGILESLEKLIRARFVNGSCQGMSDLRQKIKNFIPKLPEPNKWLEKVNPLKDKDVIAAKEKYGDHVKEIERLIAKICSQGCEGVDASTEKSTGCIHNAQEKIKSWDKEKANMSHQSTAFDGLLKSCDRIYSELKTEIEREIGNFKEPKTYNLKELLQSFFELTSKLNFHTKLERRENVRKSVN